MTDYTPGDIEVRSAYIERQWNTAAILSDVSGPWFDRWLAAHDEQVRAAERERCIRAVEHTWPFGSRDVNRLAAMSAIHELPATPAEQKESSVDEDPNYDNDPNSRGGR